MAAQRISDAAMDKLERIVTFVRGDDKDSNEKCMSALKNLRERIPKPPFATEHGTPIDREKVNKSEPVNKGIGGSTVVSVVNTLFGSCVGNRVTGQKSRTVKTDAMGDMANQIRKNLGKRQIPKAHLSRNRKHMEISESTSEDECYYAQFYDDDHGRVARATLLMRQNEARQQKARKDRVEQIQRDAIQEAEQITPRYENDLSNVEQLNRSLDRAVSRSCSILKNGQIGYDVDNHFDDEISALSAHTLEEMLAKEGIFDISRQVRDDKNSLPPSPTITESSESEEHDELQSPPENENNHDSLYARRQKTLQSNQPVHEKCHQNEQRDIDTQSLLSNELKINTTEERQRSSENEDLPNKPTAANSSGKSFNFGFHPHDVYPMYASIKKGRSMLRLNRGARKYREFRDTTSPTRRVLNSGEI